MKRLPILLLGLMLWSIGPASAQYFRQSSYWKTQRQELTLGAGMSNFLGELGGRNQIGSPFLWDLEVSQTKPALSFGYRYYTTRKTAIRANLTYGILAGNDNLTEEPFRQNRNLHFKSDIFELTALFEFHLYQEELGHQYDLRGVKGTKSSRVGLYAFLGIGGFYFNPKAQFNGQWVDLQPLSTEGQGLPGGAEPYKKYSIAIPMGLGIRKAMSKQFSIGLELQHSKTFTDYIDDVSTVYYDDEVLADARGPVAAFLSDPSLNNIEGGGDPTATGQQRGDDKDKDAYFFLKFQVHYKILKYRGSSKKYRTRIRRQKIVF